MRILSFDTSTPHLTLALLKDGVIVKEERIEPNEPSRQEAVSRLVPSIDEIMRSQKWSPEWLDLIIVGIGPGSFTGIRIAVVTARTLAQALGIGLIGMDALRSCANSLSPAALEEPALIVLPGGRGHYFVAVYYRGEEDEPWRSQPIKCLVEPRHADKDELTSILDKANKCFIDEKLVGELAFISDTRKSRGDGTDTLRCEPIPKSINLAAIQARLAWADENLIGKDRESLKTMYPFEKVNPLYLREASITLKKQSS